MSHKIRNALLCAAISGITQPALAQVVPNAGDTLRQLQTAPPVAPKPNPEFNLQSAPAGVTKPGGAAVEIKAIRFDGNQMFSSDKLMAVLGSPIGKSYDLAGLKTLTDRVTDYYHAHGYPFARALVPAQGVKDGDLLIYVIEGRYGAITAAGDPATAKDAQPFLDGLHSGDIITAPPLERSVLILNDQPGYGVTPIMRPGKEFGTGDLVVEVKPTKSFSFGVFADNEGNRYTGQTRARLTADFDSPFTFGDQLSFQGVYTEENLFLGEASYSAPVGSSGLRATVSYAETAYQIGREFSSLDAEGTAGVASVGLSYPLIRSQRANLTVGVSYQHKTLDDLQAGGAFDNARESDLTPITMQFDFRDAILGGSVTYGALVFSPGSLSVGSGFSAVDGFDAGYFGKFNFDAARVQTLGGDFSLYTRVSAQWTTGQNLDSSESFILGGATGVRAYPLGEGAGDQGYLAQFELRYSAGSLNPFVFYDLGSTSIVSHFAGIPSSARTLGGGGIGLRSNWQGWQLETSIAWKSAGGKPLTDPYSSNPQGWVTLGYQF